MENWPTKIKHIARQAIGGEHSEIKEAEYSRSAKELSGELS